MLNFTRFHEHNVVARAGNHVWVHLNNGKSLVLLNLSFHLWSQVFVELPDLNLPIAARAVRLLVIGELLHSVLHQTVDVNLVETFSRLDHSHFAFFALLRQDQSIAKLAAGLFSFPGKILVKGGSSLSFGWIHEEAYVLSVHHGLFLLFLVRWPKHVWNLFHLFILLIRRHLTL